jgi:hypothetical protein
MQNRVSPARPLGRIGKQPRARNLALRNSEVEHCAGKMFGGVNRARDIQNLLRARHANVVRDRETEVRKASPQPRARDGGKRQAARSSVQV